MAKLVFEEVVEEKKEPILVGEGREPIVVQGPPPNITPQIQSPFLALRGAGGVKIPQPSATSIPQLEQADPLGSLATKAKRLATIPINALGGDVPFLRQQIPEVIRNIKPETGLEKTAFVGTKLARDLYAYSKAAPLKGVKWLAAMGGIGAATARSEKPLDIVASAGKEAALMGALSTGIKYGPKLIGAGYEKFVPGAAKERMRKVGQWFGTAIKKTTDAAKLRFKRHSEINLAGIEGEQFARELEANLTREELEALPFLIEKTGIPRKLGKPELIKAVQDPERRKVMVEMSKKLGEKYDDFHKQLVEIYGDDVGYISGYVNRLWDVPKEKQADVVNWFMKRTGYIKNRRIGTIQEGVNKFGLVPKTTNAAELYRFYNHNVTQTMANMSYSQALSKLKTPESFEVITKSGKKLQKKLPMIVRADNAPKSWRTYDHPALNKAISIGKSKDGKQILMKSPVKVHPEIYDEIETIFGSKLGGDKIKAFESINAYAKYSQLTLSLFHHVALTEAALATGVASPKNIYGVFKAWKNGEKPILNNPIARDAIEKGGVQLGAPTDMHRNLLESSLMELEGNISKKFGGKILAAPVKGARKLIQANNKFLWDYLHPQYKLLAYERLTKDAMGMQKFAHLAPDQIKREVGQFVNDTFGGQAWDLMLKSPQWKQGAHALLLSPDWTLSTIRQALSPFGGAGAVSSSTKALRAELGQNFWKMSAMIQVGSMNQLNRAFTELYDGIPRNMWDNEPGKETTPFIGYGKDGRRKYLRSGKQFRELPEFFIDPAKKLGGKMSPAIQFATKFLSGVTPSGYTKKDIQGQKFWSKQALLGRAKLLPETFLPYSAQAQIKSGEFNPLQLAFPISKGMNYYKLQETFADSISKNNTGLAKKAFQAGLENGIPESELKRIYKKAQRELNYKESGGYRRANEIADELENIEDTNLTGRAGSAQAFAKHIAYIESLNLDEATKKRVGNVVTQRIANEEELEKFRKTGTIPKKFLDLIKGTNK